MRRVTGVAAIAMMMFSGLLATPADVQDVSRDAASRVRGGQMTCVGVGQNVSLCGWTFCTLYGETSATWPTPYGSGSATTRAVPCPCGSAGGQVIGTQQVCGTGG